MENEDRLQAGTAAGGVREPTGESDFWSHPGGNRASMVAEVVDDEEAVPTVPAVHRRFWISAVPSWLVSLLVHVVLIVILAAISLDPAQRVIRILQASSGQAPEALREFELQGPQLDPQTELDQPLSVPNPTVTPTLSVPELSTPLDTSLTTDRKRLETNAITESIIPSSLLSSAVSSQMTVALNSRSAASKSELLERFGGNSASEKAVRNALQWIAAHQSRRTGGWTFTHGVNCRNQCNDEGSMASAENAATAMALLPFLGAGQTHIEGEYKDTVKRGLAFLIKRMQVSRQELPQGSWHEEGGRMYSHGLAAITVCEAYAMTRDPDLLQPAQLSLNYLINAQDPRGGGWRYEPREAGDTSVVGWCVMALKSGSMGNLAVPRNTFIKANEFLDFVSVNQGAYYGYDRPTSSIDGRHATTAVGLLCRMYMGYSKDHPGIKAGVEYLSKTGPRTSDLYYSYYATQVLRHYGGPEWENWNRKMRDELVAKQVKEGHALGSWPTGGPHSDHGGRLYNTSLACMILEVYYRHMPLYSEKFSDEDFEL